MEDLRKVLQRCREHGISLNPKKSFFCVTKGKLIGHIVSQEGIKIDPDKVEAIQRLNFLVNKIGVKSFFGQVNFLRRFVLDFAETSKHIVDMMKGSPNFKWNEAGKRAFQDIKTAIANAPVLCHPNYKKNFIIYCYASEHTLSVILMQENDEGIQAPIAFMSVPLKNHELKYSQIEKKHFCSGKSS